MPICGGGLSSRVRKGLTITLREVSRGSSLPLLLGIPPLIGLMSLGLQCVEWLNLNGTFSVPSASSHIGHVMRQKASCSSSLSLLMLAMLPFVSERHGVPDAACSATPARRKGHRPRRKGARVTGPPQGKASVAGWQSIFVDRCSPACVHARLLCPRACLR